MGGVSEASVEALQLLTQAELAFDRGCSIRGAVEGTVLAAHGGCMHAAAAAAAAAGAAVCAGGTSRWDGPKCLQTRGSRNSHTVVGTRSASAPSSARAGASEGDKQADQGQHSGSSRLD